MSWIAVAKEAAGKSFNADALELLPIEVHIAGPTPSKKTLLALKKTVEAAIVNLVPQQVAVMPKPPPVDPKSVSIADAVVALKSKGFGLVSFDQVTESKQITKLTLCLEYVPGFGKPIHDCAGVHEFYNAWTGKA